MNPLQPKYEKYLKRPVPISPNIHQNMHTISTGTKFHYPIHLIYININKDHMSTRDSMLKKCPSLYPRRFSIRGDPKAITCRVAMIDKFCKDQMGGKKNPCLPLGDISNCHAELVVSHPSYFPSIFKISSLASTP